MTKLKSKVIKGGSPSNLETGLNRFLETINEMDIVSITQSGDEGATVVVIVYKDYTEEEGESFTGAVMA
jgi:nitrate reductase NapAB chaperone NapD